MTDFEWAELRKQVESLDHEALRAISYTFAHLHRITSRAADERLDREMASRYDEHLQREEVRKSRRFAPIPLHGDN